MIFLLLSVGHSWWCLAEVLCIFGSVNPQGETKSPLCPELPLCRPRGPAGCLFLFTLPEWEDGGALVAALDAVGEAICPHEGSRRQDPVASDSHWTVHFKETNV